MCKDRPNCRMNPSARMRCLALLLAVALLGACVSRQAISGTHTLRVESGGVPGEINLGGRGRGATPATVTLRYRGVREKRINPWFVGLGVTALVLAPLTVVGSFVLADVGRTLGGFLSGGEKPRNIAPAIGLALGAVFAALGSLALYYSSSTVDRVESGPFALAFRRPQRPGRYSLSIDARGAPLAQLTQIGRVVLDVETNTWRVERSSQDVKLRAEWQGPEHLRPKPKPSPPTRRPKDILSEIMSFR